MRIWYAPALAPVAGLLKSPETRTAPPVACASKRARASRSEAARRRCASERLSRCVLRSVKGAPGDDVQFADGQGGLSRRRVAVQRRKEPAPGYLEGSKGVLLW